MLDCICVSSQITHPQPPSNTPLLDRIAPLPKPEGSDQTARHTGRLIGAIMGILLPVVCVAMMIWVPGALDFFYRIFQPVNQALSRVMRLDNWALDTVFLLLSAWLAIIAAVVVHEIGHMIAGLGVGFRLNFIRFGPVQISPPFHVSLLPRSRTKGSGATSMLFATTDRLRLRFIAMTLGGPMANLVSAFAVLILPLSMGAFSAWFVILSILIGSGNLVPFRRLSLVSDGQRILMVMRNGPQGERWSALLHLVTALQNGVAPESLSLDFLAKATAVQDNSPDTVSAHAVAYASAFFQKNDVEAARLLETCLRYSSCSGPAMRDSLLSDAAVFQARRRRRVDLAEQWLADIPNKTQTPGLRLRAEAAILEAQGDIGGALSKLDAYEAAALTIPTPSQRELSLRFLRRWQSELQIEQNRG